MMLPYFYQFKEHILNQEDCLSLRNLSTFNKNKYWDYYSAENNIQDGNRILGPNSMSAWDLLVTDGVKQMIDNINVETYPTFIRHSPKSSVITHRDDKINKRNTVLSIPLWPTKNYPPTYFRDKKLGPVVATALFEDMRPCLLNTQIWHDLINTSDVCRLNFQLCFFEPIEVIAKMVEDNTLWSNQ